MCAVLNGAMDSHIAGFCRPEFEAVREAFCQNFEERGEVGAAVTVMIDGEIICDLWGGLADAELGRQWNQDTIVDFYSSGKPIVATLLLRMVDDGRVDHAQ